MSDEKTCEKCDWWKEKPLRKHEGRWGRCEMADSEAHEDSTAMMTACGMSDIGGCLDTRPSFGCNRWEPKESEK